MDFHLEIREVSRLVSGQVEQISVRTGRADQSQRVHPYSPRPCQEARKSTVGK